MKVKTAFLNGNLEEKIYMDQPICFVSKGQEGKIYCFKCFVYDLNQSFRAWYFRFYKPIISFSLNMVQKTIVCTLNKLQRGLYSLPFVLTTYYWLETI